MTRRANRIPGAIAAFRRALANRGGGVRGALAVAVRAASVVRMLGWRALMGRLDAASQVTQPRPSLRAAARPAALPLEQVDLKVGVMLHLFHGDLLEEFSGYLANMPVPFSLLVSVPDGESATRARAQLAGMPRMHRLDVRVAANRGRDWAPLLVDFRDEVQALDLVCHVHSKKSLYSGRRRDDWRGSLLDTLLGSRAKVAWILGMFQADPRLGLVFPETFGALPYWAHGWLQNAAPAAELARQMGFGIDRDASFDYPVGSMFWVRVDGLRPLLDLGLSTSDFPVETGQTDGTLQHALERLVAPAALHGGYRFGILPLDGAHAMADEGERNWQRALEGGIGARFRLAAAGATAISVDVFDTLLLRPFLSPAGFHGYLEHLVHARWGRDGFAASRKQAEDAARMINGRDPDLDDIYRALANLRPDLPAAGLSQLERGVDAAHLRPRAALVEALARDPVPPMVAISDTYYHAGELHAMLPAALQARIGRIEASCDAGVRKDSGDAWRRIAHAPGADPARWLHVGDNPCSDVQIPQDLGFRPPLHALRPGALLELVPVLRPLSPGPPAATPWEDSLWLGLVANRLSHIADTEPGCFRDGFVVPDADTFGYVVVGPLLHDFIAWTARNAMHRGCRDLLFLSREGWLFERCFQRLAATTGRLGEVRGHYFLASRLATGVASLQDGDDLRRLFAGTYAGPLAALLHARLGAKAADLARIRGLDDGDAFLPEMRDAIVRRLYPLLGDLLALARIERDAYRDYWMSLVGDAGSAIPTVVDLGYSGTIQANLARLLDRPLHGNYMALRAGAPAGEAMQARYFDGRSGADPSTSSILGNDLMLEALLTAPAGQLWHFEREPTGVVPRYLPGTEPADPGMVEAIHAGALAFVDDLHRVVGADALNLAFDQRLVQVPLELLGDRSWRPGPWAAGLGVEDHYSGRGVVSPFAVPRA